MENVEWRMLNWGSAVRTAPRQFNIQHSTFSIQHLLFALHTSLFVRYRGSQVPSNPESPPPRDAYAALRIPDFRRILISHATSTVAREGQMVVVGWQVDEHTRDPLSLGLIGLAEAVPFIAV